MSGEPDQTAKEDFTKGALNQLLEHAEEMHAVGAFGNQALEDARK